MVHKRNENEIACQHIHIQIQTDIHTLPTHTSLIPMPIGEQVPH